MQDTGKPAPNSLKQLIIRATPEGFLFGKVSARGTSISKLRIFAPIDFPDKLVAFLKDNKWTARPDLKVSVIDFTSRFMLVPNKVADDRTLEDYFRFQNGDEGEMQIYTAPFDDGKQMFCWEIAAERDRQLEKYLPNMTLWSSSYLIANWTYHQAAKSDISTMTAHFYGHHMQVFMADTRRMLFANTFVVRNSEEIAYFLLRCLEQVGLDPATVQTYICSDSTMSYSELQALLSPYIAHLFEAEFSLRPDSLFRIAKEDKQEEDENEEEDEEFFKKREA
ncbi:MAG TPA: DUF3822 family protein [Bacteroidales bacterium]|nr:DUF3822 family protein [Bacteroidales bacterium]